MYGVFGGVTTIFHTAVRFPILVTCLTAGGVAYEAATCPPPEPTPAVVHTFALADNVLFDFDKHNLTPDATTQLNTFVAKLKALPRYNHVQLVGHADRFGGAEHNQVLSDQRSDAIRAYLVDHGVPSDKIKYVGVSTKQPVAVCSTTISKSQQIACLHANRNVSISVQID